MKILSTSHRNFQEFWEDVAVYLYVEAWDRPPRLPQVILAARSIHKSRAALRI